MVTRYIKKNTPVQVNSHLIGVEVYPDNVITGITVKGHWTRWRCQNVSENTGFWTSDNNVVYRKASGYVPVDGTPYYQWKRSTFWGNDSGYPDKLFVKEENLTSANIGDALYTIDLTDPENPVLSEYSETVGPIVPEYTGGNKYFIQVMDIVNDDCFMCLSGDATNLYKIDMATSSVYEVSSGDYYSIITASPSSVTNQDIVCDSYVQEDEDSGYWIDSDNLTYNGPLWGSDTPAVGDTLNFFESKNEYNQQTVDSLIYEAGTVDCTVEYSVTGDTWNQVGSNMTDVNNVIANVPKYVYLRFSQDVEITEE